MFRGNLNPYMSFAGHVRKTKDVTKLARHPPRQDLDPDPLCSTHVQGVVPQTRRVLKSKLSIFLLKSFHFK